MYYDMATDTTDPEKGLLSVTARSAIPSGSSSAPDDAIIDASSRNSPLKLFQLLVGINTPQSLTQDSIDGRVGASKFRRHRTDNIGLYQNAKEQERASRLAYISTSFISNTLYMVQILLAATFTAMSAYKDSHRVTLTVLGALNTVVAGSLAWQKGQGVPQRYRKARDEYQALVLEIEMVERSFLALENGSGQGDVKLDPRTEKERLQKLYNVAKADEQANYPDLLVATGAHAGKDHPKDLSKELEDAKAEAVKVQNEMMAKIEALMAKLAGKVDTHVDDAIQSVVKT